MVYYTRDNALVFCVFPHTPLKSGGGALILKKYYDILKGYILNIQRLAS